MVGTVLGSRYELLEKVGTGGMAIVYKAKDKLLDRFVAIKILRDEFKGDDEFIHRFKVESQAAACLSHQNIITVHDVGEQDGMNYIVMELLEGKTLKDYINENAPLYWREALDFAIQICSALEHAHSKGVVHRDIKPQNIILSDRGTVKVSDFGIARAANKGTTDLGANALGSAHYISPEQARGGYTDSKSDIYSLGVVLYEMCTGKLPFDGENTITVAMQHIQEQPIAPCEIKDDIPKSVEAIILKAMNKEQLLRYESASQMLEDLRLVYMDPDVKIEVKKQEQMGGTKRIPTTEVRKQTIIDSKSKELKRDFKESKENRKKKSKSDTVAIISAIGTALLIGAVLFYFLIKVLFPASDYKTAKVPDLYNKTVEEAEKLLTDCGLTLSPNYDKAYSNDVEEGLIVDQNYQSGTEVASGREIVITLSEGPAYIVMENYTGKNFNVVQYELSGEGLTVSAIYEESQDGEEGYILRQDPQEGTKLKKGDLVTLYICKKPTLPATTIIPNVVGKPTSEAKSKLIEKGFLVSVLETDSQNKDVVVKQSPSAGNEVTTGTTITIYVGNGKQVPAENTDKKEETNTNQYSHNGL